MRWYLGIALALGLLAGAGCSGGGDPEAASATAGATGQRFPEVTEVEVTASGGAYDFDVTISSPYDTPERYADGWRILAPDGAVIGEMTLGHDHASEQPFTRSQTGVVVPPGIRRVTVEGRDRINGYGGATRTADLPGR